MDPPPAEPDTAGKLLYLRSRYASAGDPDGLAPAIETHMAWVVLGRDQVVKLKKPVRYPFLDFSTLAAREHAVREELRLNRRLAPQVYLGVLALRWHAGRFALVPPDDSGAGRTVDWVVLMQRLPADRMLDRMLAQGPLDDARIGTLSDVLVDFYHHAAPAGIEPAAYVAGLQRELHRSRQVVLRPAFGLTHAAALFERAQALLLQHRRLLHERVRAGRIVDGHGDLRPEHVCLLQPPVIIDALEFNAGLRQVDPYDELAFLGLECRMLGDARIGPVLAQRHAQALGDPVPPALPRLYTLLRALLRARLSVAHLLDPQPRTPSRWMPQTQRYLAHARGCLEAD